MSRVPPSTPLPQGQSAPVATVVCPPGTAVTPAAPTVPQQVYIQPVAVQPAPATEQRVAPGHEGPHPQGEAPAVYFFSHSQFFYWWPVWLTGYILAALTRVDGQLVDVGGTAVWFHPSKNLGVIFTLIFFLVILITNVSLRGLSSVVAILAFAFTALALAYFGLWEDLLNWMGRVAIYMNMGFYVFFSSLVFGVWAFSVFVYDRMAYWRVTPGQITYEHVIGGAAKSYDTRGMVFEKHRQDLFRHWVLGLGSGDIQISTTGARKETIYVPNVLFVDSKIGEIQQMISMRPDQFQGAPPQ
jgi:hypothetical protein